MQCPKIYVNSLSFKIAITRQDEKGVKKISADLGPGAWANCPLALLSGFPLRVSPPEQISRSAEAIPTDGRPGERERKDGRRTTLFRDQIRRCEEGGESRISRAMILIALRIPRASFSFAHERNKAGKTTFQLISRIRSFTVTHAPLSQP